MPLELAHGSASPGDWPFEPITWALLVTVGVAYLSAARRLRAWPASRSAAFVGALVALTIGLASPLATYAHAYFAGHMVQHLLLIVVAAPLLLLGAPVTLLLRASGVATRRQIVSIMHSPIAMALSHPLVGWVALAVVLWGSHMTGLYGLALRNGTIHVVEHALYLGTALLFWWPIVGLGPGADRLAHPLRLVYLALAIPVNVFLALAIYSASEVLYPHYGAGALDDQRAGALIMWFGADPPIVIALVATFFGWVARDAKAARRIDRTVSELN